MGVKLRRLKKVTNSWAWDEYRNMEDRVKVLVDQIAIID
jgi:hypothetical protein